MDYKVITLSIDHSLSNSYCLVNSQNECLLFDLGYNKDDYIEKYLEKHDYKCLGLFLTHGHYDHILGINYLSLPQNFPIYISSNDYRCLFDPKYNLTSYLDKIVTIDEKYKINELEEGKMSIKGFEFEVIATPFHTSGSLCFYFEKEKIMFSGDTLFKLGIGRMDLPGNERKMVYSSLDKIKKLDKETLIYPGHGSSTRLEDELKFNPYLK